MPGFFSDLGLGRVVQPMTNLPVKWLSPPDPDFSNRKALLSLIQRPKNAEASHFGRTALQIFDFHSRTDPRHV
jgi:hypothetical protein